MRKEVHEVHSGVKVSPNLEFPIEHILDLMGPASQVAFQSIEEVLNGAISRIVRSAKDNSMSSIEDHGDDLNVVSIGYKTHDADGTKRDDKIWILKHQ